MTVNVSQAAATYARAAAKAVDPGLGVPTGQAGENFGDLVAHALADAAGAARRGEQVSIQAVANQADLNDIVTAVNNAEMTLQTVVAIRDRVIQAYQEILRMPI